MLILVERSSLFSEKASAEGFLAELLAKIDVDTIRLTFNQDSGGSSLAIEFPNDQESIRSLFASCLALEPQTNVNFSLRRSEDIVDEEILTLEPPELFLPSGKPVAIPVDLRPLLPQLFQAAGLISLSITYTVILNRRNTYREFASNLIPALAECERVSHPIADLTRDVFERAQKVGWYVVEGFVVAEETKRWVEEQIRLSFAAQHTWLEDNAVALNVSSTAKTNSLATEAARIKNSEYLAEVMGALLPASPVLLERVPNVEAIEPKPGNAVFVSYARADSSLDRIKKVLDGIGVNYWYDDDMETGVEWDEELEERLRNSFAVVACVSKAYQESKYCRRELKFADLIEKPILPVTFEGAIWEPGLQMMFQELQITTLDSDQAVQKLSRSIDRVRSD